MTPERDRTETWREMYVAVASLYAELLERFDLAEDAQPDDIIRAARADIVAAAKTVVERAEPDDDFDGEFVDFLVPHDAIEGLRDAIKESDDRA